MEQPTPDPPAVSNHPPRFPAPPPQCAGPRRREMESCMSGAGARARAGTLRCSAVIRHSVGPRGTPKKYFSNETQERSLESQHFSSSTNRHPGCPMRGVPGSQGDLCHITPVPAPLPHPTLPSPINPPGSGDFISEGQGQAEVSTPACPAAPLQVHHHTCTQRQEHP